MKILANKRLTNKVYRQVLFSPSEGLGQLTTTKKKTKTRKAPGGINPAVVLSALGVQNILRPGKSW